MKKRIIRFVILSLLLVFSSCGKNTVNFPLSEPFTAEFSCVGDFVCEGVITKRENFCEIVYSTPENLVATSSDGVFSVTLNGESVGSGQVAKAYLGIASAFTANGSVLSIDKNRKSGVETVRILSGERNYNYTYDGGKLTKITFDNNEITVFWVN